MDALLQREEKVWRLTQLGKLYPDRTVVAMRLNIPGPEKKNDWIDRAFQEILARFLKMLDTAGIAAQQHEKDFAHGYYENLCIMTCDVEPTRLKRITTAFEEETPFGRIVDLDVVGVSRKALGMAERKCFVCDAPAFVCARDRKHSVEEMLQVLILMTESL